MMRTSHSRSIKVRLRLDLEVCEERRELAIFDLVTMRGGREASRPNVPGVLGKGAPELAMEVGVLPNELRRESIEQPEQVVADEHLAVAVGPRADADRDDAQPFGDQRGDAIGNRFENQRVTASVLQEF